MVENNTACETFNRSSYDAHTVDPSRLSMGQWDDLKQAFVGEGDIYNSYSADTIAIQSTIRKPFRFKGEQWVSISSGSCHGHSTQSKAYRLALRDQFNGQSQSYAEKTQDCEAARDDPNGFYHGIEVRYRKQTYVLAGPPVHFVPGTPKPPQQPGLFDQATTRGEP